MKRALMQHKGKAKMIDQPRSFITYIVELRTRLLYCLIAFAGLLAFILPFSNYFYRWLAIPLLNQLPQTSHLIATDVAATFFVPLKFAMLLSFALIIPFILYQAWLFVMPALYQRERNWVWLFMLSGTLLFYSGMLFAYGVVFPLLFQFFVQTTPMNVLLLPDISAYLSLALQLLMAFGIAFEVPIVIVLLALVGIDVNRIAQQRRYFIVAAFIIAMFLTPPDVVSQTLLAVPLCLLFELGLLAARVIAKNEPTWDI